MTDQLDGYNHGMKMIRKCKTKWIFLNVIPVEQRL